METILKLRDNECVTWDYDEEADVLYIAKPIRSRQGRGVFAVMGRDASTEVDHRTHILQACLENHPTISRIAGPRAGLCTLRAYTLKTSDSLVFYGGFFRLARAGSVVDNIHQGGLGCPVDIATGVVKAAAFDAEKLLRWDTAFTVTEHPDTGEPFADRLVLPHWEATRELCLKAHRLLGPDLMLCAWDVTFTEDRPLLVEAASCMGGSLEYLNRPDYRLYVDTLKQKIQSICRREELADTTAAA
jgi:glutathione synthase/RimK-type ligase-like ATP-grasp enzyme